VTALPLLFYALAAASYAVEFARRGGRAGRAGTGLLVLGLLAHTFVIGMQTMDLGFVPIVGTSGAVSAFVWLLGIAYLYVELSTNERAMGAFIVSLMVALQLIPTLDPRVGERPAVLQSPLFTLHVSSMLFAYASFALACVIGVTYVLLFKEIKGKHLGFFAARLPSLQVLDVMNSRAVGVGWVFLTLGVVIGALWATTLHRAPAEDPRIQAMTLLDPKIFIALLCWAVYSFELFARRAIGWRGRRAAWLSAIGFAIVLLNFVPVSYFFTRSHNF
jgi:ABC-type transport system involved in cytochrome c biogenesis permease subunit